MGSDFRVQLETMPRGLSPPRRVVVRPASTLELKIYTGHVVLVIVVSHTAVFMSGQKPKIGGYTYTPFGPFIHTILYVLLHVL